MRNGGIDGNEQLTAIVATLLLVLLAAEGATILQIRRPGRLEQRAAHKR